MVEIARALLFKSQLIIMDEPTTALSTHEIEILFEIMRQLRLEGVSFIYISHKMPELFEVCETYYVLRDGKYVASGRFSEITEAQLTEMMIGRSLLDDDLSRKPCYARAEVALSVKNLSGGTFRGVEFDLHKGEIIAITGLQGSGRDQLADALFGAEPSTGEITVNGRRVRAGSGVIHHMRQGIAMVPRARKERGILNHLSILDNTSMAFFNTKFRKLLISPAQESQRYARQKQALSIKADNPKNPITSLSGGNQQKVILGRWLETDADILIFDNPTQGIDVGTKFEIYHLILRLAESGKAILVFSSEFPEIYKVADKCMVMYMGQVAATLSRSELTEKDMMYYATGANVEGLKHA
jgi:ribose transport system ATP-binding protein